MCEFSGNVSLTVFLVPYGSQNTPLSFVFEHNIIRHFVNEILEDLSLNEVVSHLQGGAVWARNIVDQSDVICFSNIDLSE